MDAIPSLGCLSTRQSQLVENALYEACANIIEHGYGEDSQRIVDLWWLPVVGDAAGEARDPAAAPAGVAGAGEWRYGYFLIRDEGKPFQPKNWSATDLNDPEARRRGRGLGIDIIKRIMSRVIYQPGGSMGNLTLLQFELQPSPTQSEDCHV
jgi:anti-sigma regulatory factor (Ser/Thr protein kinase)